MSNRLMLRRLLKLIIPFSAALVGWAAVSGCGPVPGSDSAAGGSALQDEADPSDSGPISGLADDPTQAEGYLGPLQVNTWLWKNGVLAAERHGSRTLAQTISAERAPQTQSGEDQFIGYTETESYSAMGADWTFTTTVESIDLAPPITVRSSVIVQINGSGGTAALNGTSVETYVWNADGYTYAQLLEARGDWLGAAVQMRMELSAEMHQ